MNPPILLIHGFPFSRSMWQPQTEALTVAGYRVLAPDLTGFGAQKRLEPDKTVIAMSDYADELARLIELEGAQGCIGVGFSMGGYIALELLNRHPQLLRGLVLADTRAEADSPEGAENRRAVAARALADGTAAAVGGMPGKLLAKSASAKLRNNVEAMILQSDPRSVAAASLGMAARRDFTELLNGISLPTLIIVGADDSVTPVDGARRMFEAIPGSALSVIPAAGHLSGLEQPAAFNTALLRWLKRRFL